MRIALYIILGIILIIAGFLIWFFAFFLQVPELTIPEGADEGERIVAIDSWLQKLNEDRKFNGGILIARDGQPLLAKTYGYTNHERNEKLTNNSSFRLASLSKQFTAAGIMLLKEQNQLGYDDPVSKYIDGFPYEKVTIRNLLNQTSGIPDSYMQLAEQRKDSIGILTIKKAADLIIEHKPEVRFAPNDQYQYSNTNYILLARIIESVSGNTFEKFMKENLFDPLEMQNTRVWTLVSDEKTFPNKTWGFEDLAGEVIEIKPTFIDGVAGDGAVFSSINDFLIWDRFWYENDLISEENMKEAFKKPVLNDGKISSYGFGWVVLNEGLVMHNGAWLAANTYIVRNTEKKTCFVLLDNSSSLFFDKITENLK